MRIVVLLSFLCSFSAVALAQTLECTTLPKAGDLLACYDNGAPPLAMTKKPAASKRFAARYKPTAPVPMGGQGEYVDFLAAENSRLDAKLRTLCRGC
jgi:hypothetical protein